MKIKAGQEENYKRYVELNSQDPYSKATVEYTECWANLMEEKINSGSKVIDIATRASQEADTEGIIGFMFGCAARALLSFWEYGDKLKEWCDKYF